MAGRILAMGGGGVLSPGSRLEQLLLELSGKPRPRVAAARLEYDVVRPDAGKVDHRSGDISRSRHVNDADAVSRVLRREIHSQRLSRTE